MMTVVAPALIVTSSAGPGSASVDQLRALVQFTPSPPPSQNTAAGVVRSSSEVRCRGTGRRIERRLGRGASQVGNNVRSIGTSLLLNATPRAPRTSGHAQRARGGESLGSGNNGRTDAG